MTIEYLPNGIACDLSCKYCYQDPMRAAGNISAPLSFHKVKETLLKQNHAFSVFGGEALLTPKPKLEEIFKFGLENYGHNSIQTNGLRLDADHIAMFQKYKVSVGISIDGWNELNSARSTLEQTSKILTNIELLVKAKIIPSIIVTVHRVNAKPDLLKFLHCARFIGVSFINLHILETDSPEVKRDLELTDAENFDIFRMIYDEFEEHSVFSPFSDIIQLLTKEHPQTNCVWNACDAINTAAVQGVAPDGSLINCGRTNKDGVNWLKTNSSSKERYLALYNTPLQYGGCQGCKYFFACKGQCPGTAIDGDWRNKTAHCQFWYSMIEYIWVDLTMKGEVVFSEEKMYQMGERFIRSITSTSGHTDAPHGDSPHGDSHGDHTDSKGIEVSWID